MDAGSPHRPHTSRKNAPHKSTLRQYLEALALGILVSFAMRASVVQAEVIASGSMRPTLLVGDHFLVNKLIYGLRMPDSIFGVRMPWGRYLFRLEPIHRGDVVVFLPPQEQIPAETRGEDWIKRVIALPGDTVEVRQGVVWLNGAPMADPHAYHESQLGGRLSAPRDNFPPTVVPAGKLFVMGDNRDDSFDSRYWGFADQGQVKGRAMVVFWSWDSGASNPIRWDRFGKQVD